MLSYFQQFLKDFHMSSHFCLESRVFLFCAQVVVLKSSARLCIDMWKNENMILCDWRELRFTGWWWTMVQEDAGEKKKETLKGPNTRCKGSSSSSRLVWGWVWEWVRWSSGWGGYWQHKFTRQMTSSWCTMWTPCRICYTHWQVMLHTKICIHLCHKLWRVCLADWACGSQTQGQSAGAWRDGCKESWDCCCSSSSWLEWAGQANPKPKLLPGQSSPEPSKSVSPCQEVMSQTLRKEIMGQRWQCKTEQWDRQSGCSNTGSCAKTQGAAGGSHRWDGGVSSTA